MRFARVVAKGELTVGDTVHQVVDAERRDRVRANHSATHCSTRRCAIGSATM